MLQTYNLNVRYGSFQALQDISLQIQTGELVTIVGSHGAGKTTLLKSISGALPVQSGSIFYQERDLTRVPGHVRASMGIAHVPAGRKVFPTLSVLENLTLGAYRTVARPQRQASLHMVFALFPVLYERRRRAAGTLSGGEQQMLALGRGLMLCPDLLLLDEPSLGLSPRMVEVVFESIRGIQKARQLAILLVEQRVVEALDLCDRGYVLESGQVALEGNRDILLRDEWVQRAYWGR